MGEAPRDNQFSPNPSHYTNYPTGYLPSTGRLTTSGMSDHPSNSREQYGSSPGANSQSSFPSQIQQQQNYYQQQQSGQNSSNQSNMNQASGLGRPSALNMASLGHALPDYGQGSYQQQSPQRFATNLNSSAQLAYQLQQLQQYGTPAGSNQPPSPAYNLQFSQQFQGMYAPNQGQSGQPGQQQFYANQGFPQRQGQQPQGSPFYYQAGPQFQGQPAMFPAATQFQAQYGNRMGVPGDKQPSIPHSKEQLAAGTIGRAHSNASSTAPSPIIRGPPRKPKQSGHALWVGNLPPGANVIDLKDHFSRDATDDILSVFLISKSNCAFVNYKTEDACAKAVERFNESRFQGVRLLCRLRRTSVFVGGAKDGQSKGVPTGPAALSQNQTPAPSQQRHEGQNGAQTTDGNEGANASEDCGHAKEKFFVVKSLTVEDLETSVRTGQWATQAHNEEALNKAYKEADTVYLIFSANKSGEYFGYARMTSPINHDPSKAIEFAPSVTAAAAVEDADLPKAIPTPATETAPKGRIIDDSARGTIFWEAEGNEDDKAKEKDQQTNGVDGEEGQSGNSNQTSGDEQAGERDQKAWGKPFSLEWLSTNRVPFYRTRGLRNAWNANREVKIARDGTELETGVGRRLIAMFAREHSPGGGPPMLGGQMMGAGVFGPPGMGMPRY